MAAPLSDEELQYVQSLFDHAREGRTSDLTAALDAGVPVNLTNSAGDTLLILAAYHVHPETVGALLSRGADTSRVNDMGQTALGADCVGGSGVPSVRRHRDGAARRRS